MKLANIQTPDGIHLAVMTGRGLVDVTAAGCKLTMQDLICGADLAPLAAPAADGSLPVVQDPVFANVVNPAGKLVCVGFNYRSHADATGFQVPKAPNLFSKYADALVPCGAEVELPPWEVSYDYEAELVIVMGKTAWNVSEEDALQYVFGYTCGNDLSCRESQFRASQFLVGKTMPGFGPCGPWIITADSFDPSAPHSIRSYVNGELRQDGCITEMIFNCAQLISYASKYIRLEPGDLIFTGTPSGVSLEKKDEGDKVWLKPGDVVDIEIEGIGTRRKQMKSAFHPIMKRAGVPQMGLRFSYTRFSALYGQLKILSPDADKGALLRSSLRRFS